MSLDGKPMSVAQAARAAALLLDRAAVLDHLGSQVISEFTSSSNRPPKRLLQRRGEGPRPADGDAIFDLSEELAVLAANHRARAHILLAADATVVDVIEELADEDEQPWEARVVEGGHVNVSAGEDAAAYPEL